MLAETIASIEEANPSAHVFKKDATQPCYYAFTLSDEIRRNGEIRSGNSVTDAIEAILTKLP